MISGASLISPVGTVLHTVLMETQSLFERMQESLERRSANRRRTMFLDGKAVAAALSGAFQERLPGTPWYEDQFQRGIVSDEQGDSLVSWRRGRPSTRTGGAPSTSH